MTMKTITMLRAKKFFILTVIILVSANAGLREANGTQLSYFGPSNGWIQIADDEGIVTPGGGGQLFDAEYLFYKIADDVLSIGLQSGFDLVDGQVLYKNKKYYSGDLALSFDGDTGNYEYAFDFGLLTKNYYNNTVGGSPDVAGLYANVDWNKGVYTKYQASNPFAMNSGSFVSTANASTTAGQEGDSYWRTVSFDVTSLHSFTALDVHWTMSCGNDVIEAHTNMPNTSPVSEPATMVLLGSGLAGLAGYVRRFKAKS